ncbi:hypothetical protein PV371_15475 [Streptomyces sp. TX20-6-3]|nr:hypothetical protein [Streptomyces sp. TX20-6-3]MDX2561049.1 hypothetical protein [Streptomyces sp. TX20-6-3]
MRADGPGGWGGAFRTFRRHPARRLTTAGQAPVSVLLFSLPFPGLVDMP